MRRIPYGFFGMAFEWWMRLNPWIHYTIALLLIGGSTLAHFRGEIWPWGWVAGGIILVLLLFRRQTPS